MRQDYTNGFKARTRTRSDIFSRTVTRKSNRPRSLPVASASIDKI